MHAADMGVVRESVKALGRLRAAESIDSLRELLLPTSDSNVRILIAKSLGQIGGRDSINVLLEKYDLFDPVTVNSAFIQMGLFDAALRKDDPSVSSRQRRHLKLAMKIARDELKVLVENDTLSKSDLNRVLSKYPIM